MPRPYSQKDLVELEKALDEGGRYVDLAVRFRVLNEDGSPGRMLLRRDGQPRIYGGRWDLWARDWVRPQPRDLLVHEWTIQEQQIPFLVETSDDVMFVGLFAGRQAGKTTASVMDDALAWLRNPGRLVSVVSLNYKTSREPELAFKALLAPWWRAKEIKTEREYRLPHGARFVFRSWEAIDSLRGPSLLRITLDEASRMKEEAFTTAVGCGSASKGFRLKISTTPKRETKWTTAKQREWGQPEDREARVFQLDSEKNPRRNRKLLERLKRELPADLYEQEFKGKMVAPQHAVWYLFDRALHLRRAGDLPEQFRFGLLEPPRDWTREFCEQLFRVPADRIAGWDFGKEAVTLARIFRETRRIEGQDGKARIEHKLRLFFDGEAVNTRTTTEHHAHDVAEKWGTNIVVITDAMGQHERADGRGVTASAAPIKLLREAGFMRVVPVAKQNPDVENSIRACLRMLRNAKDDTTVFFDEEKCPTLVEALENQERDESGAIKKDGREHVIDSFRYLAWRCFPVKTPFAEGWRPAAAVRGA